METRGQLWTVGHSNRPVEVLIEMLAEAGIRRLVDVRRFPGSRRNPQFSGEALSASLADAGIDYRHLPALGGRRRASPDSPNTAWRVEGFRAYADHLASAEYRQGRQTLMDWASEQPTTVMCAEALWWQCHRRLIADDFSTRGWQVWHIMGPHKIDEHKPNPDAVMVPEGVDGAVEGGVLRYPAPQSQLFGDSA